MQQFEQIEQRRRDTVVREEALRQIRDKKVLFVVVASMLAAFIILVALAILQGP